MSIFCLTLVIILSHGGRGGHQEGPKKSEKKAQPHLLINFDLVVVVRGTKAGDGLLLFKVNCCIKFPHYCSVKVLMHTGKILQ